jgi:heptaprenyl diphosphate synthase
MTGSPLGELSTDPAFDASLASSLDEVETELASAVVSDYPFVTETSRHLVEAGGKRFRPLLTVLASHFGPRPGNPDVIKSAVMNIWLQHTRMRHDLLPLKRAALPLVNKANC